jgi:2,4-diketo-3-deoxy-L-fuconate hydrolase
MRLCRFDDDRLGLVEGDQVKDVTAALEALPSARWPLPRHDPLIANFTALRPRIAALGLEAPSRPLASARLKSPVANPGKIIGAPVNYQKHLDESRADKGINFGGAIKTIDEYGLFLKAGSSLVGPSEGIATSFPDRRHDHEGELAVVIGTTAKNVPRARAMEHIAGYCCALDMTVRGTEDRSFRKSIDTYSVLGPCFVTDDEIADPGNLDLTLWVNGEERQRSNTRYLIFDIPRLIEYASSFYTLHPGDVIMTGTPEGVAPVQPGDTIRLTVEKIGTLEIAVRTAS